VSRTDIEQHSPINCLATWHIQGRSIRSNRRYHHALPMSKSLPPHTRTFVYAAYSVANDFNCTGWPKKVSHYHESLLNRIKTRHYGYIFINFDYIMSTKICQVCIKYSMYDLIWGVITCCLWSCNTGKIKASDKIMFENQKKKKIWK